MTIKLNQFDDLLIAVKKFGVVNFFSIDIEKERKQFETAGLDIDISNDVFSTDNEELFTILKDGSIRKTVIHIVDISSWRETWGHPRFHIQNCEKIKEMRENKKGYRYKASSRKDGTFYLMNKKEKWYEHLEICSYCLTLYNNQLYTKCTKQNFPLKKYIETPISHSGFLDVPLDISTIPNSYKKSWPKISQYIKEKAKYKCSLCLKDFSSPKCKKFLHTHHIDSDKQNNISENLKALCIECHSKEHNHNHIKKSPAYKEYLKSSCPKP